MRRLALACGALALIAAPATAQRVRVGLYGVTVSNSELSEAYQADGGGVGGLLSARVGRFTFELTAQSATVGPDPEALGDIDYKVREADFKATIDVAPSVAFLVGGGRRTMDPALVAQDVGFVRVGVLSANRLSGIADVWMHAAYLAAPRFSGGGDAEFSVEIGLGVRVHAPSGRFGVRADYAFQRFGRQVNDGDAPIQYMASRLGIEVGF